MGWISVPRGCPYHGLHARISARTPAAAALSPETNCPGYTNTLLVFHPGQLLLLTNNPAWSRGGPERLESEKTVVFQNKAPDLKHKLCSSSRWLQGNIEAVCKSTGNRERQHKDVKRWSQPCVKLLWPWASPVPCLRFQEDLTQEYCRSWDWLKNWPCFFPVIYCVLSKQSGTVALELFSLLHCCTSTGTKQSLWHESVSCY